MIANSRHIQARRGSWADTIASALLACLLWLLPALASPALAATAEAFTIGKAPLKITVFTGPRNDFCYSDHIDAIAKLVKAEQDRINKAGGIAGRPVGIHEKGSQ